MPKAQIWWISTSWANHASCSQVSTDCYWTRECTVHNALMHSSNVKFSPSKCLQIASQQSLPLSIKISIIRTSSAILLCSACLCTQQIRLYFTDLYPISIQSSWWSERVIAVHSSAKLKSRWYFVQSRAFNRKWVVPSTKCIFAKWNEGYGETFIPNRVDIVLV